MAQEAHAQRDSDYFHAQALALMAPDIGLSPELHARRVEPAFGDFYGVCSCGARSLPLVSHREAAQWECPREEAETTVHVADVLWRRRVADYTVTPGSR
jgi:hypothetical protein